MHYGFDPDTEGTALYLWDYGKKQMAYKLMRVRR